MATKLNPLLKPIIVSVAANDDVRTLAGGLVKTTGGGLAHSDDLIVEPGPEKPWNSAQPSIASRIPSQNQGSFAGSFVDPLTNRIVFSESNLEFGLGVILRADRRVKSIWDQPEAVDYVDDSGKPRKHTFDFLATLHCGRRIAYPVKPKARVEKSGIRRVLELIREQVGSKFADAYVLRTDEHITRARVSNAKLIISSLDCRNDEHVARVRECMAGVVGSVLIADVAARTGLEGHAVRAIACLIWDGVLQLARPGLIDQHAFITPVQTAAAA